MTLFMLVTGGIGESYERCYVWAEDREQALQLAYPICLAKYPAMTAEQLRACEMEVLFHDDARPFCTPFSDSGFARAESERTDCTSSTGAQ
jgi:hypothetical protein